MTRRNPEVEAAQVEAVVREAGLTRKQIAAHLETDEGSLSKIFQGRKQPHPLWWVRLGRLMERDEQRLRALPVGVALGDRPNMA
jgi:hypothetical protein